MFRPNWPSSDEQVMYLGKWYLAFSFVIAVVFFFFVGNALVKCTCSVSLSYMLGFIRMLSIARVYVYSVSKHLMILTV
jgi:hypothetical protein